MGDTEIRRNACRGEGGSTGTGPGYAETAPGVTTARCEKSSESSSSAAWRTGPAARGAGMAESGRPSKRHRPDPVDGSGPFPVPGAGCGSTGDSSSRSDTAAGRMAVLAQYRRWWKGDGHKTRCLRTLAGHLSWVCAVAVLEGDRIVSASNDKTLKVWSLTSGECLQTLTGHSGRVNAVAVLEGDRIVSASDDGTLKVWSLVSGECLQALTGHVSFVLAVAVLGADRAVSARASRRTCGAEILARKGDKHMNSKIPYPDERYTLASLAPHSSCYGRPYGAGSVLISGIQTDFVGVWAPYQARAPVAPVPESILFVSILHISFGHSGCLVVVVLCSHLLA